LVVAISFIVHWKLRADWRDDGINSDDVTSSIVNTLSILLAEFDRLPIDVQTQFIFQSLPFFREIFTTITPGAVPERLQQTENTFFKSVHRCINLMLRWCRDFDQFGEFLRQFLEFSLVRCCLEHLAQLFAGIMMVRDGCASSLASLLPVFWLFFKLAELH
jgi:hypothetical protein